MLLINFFLYCNFFPHYSVDMLTSSDSFLVFSLERWHLHFFSVPAFSCLSQFAFWAARVLSSNASCLLPLSSSIFVANEMHHLHYYFL